MFYIDIGKEAWFPKIKHYSFEGKDFLLATYLNHNAFVSNNKHSSEFLH